MKIICKDNFNRETVSDQLIASDLAEPMAKLLLAALKAEGSDDAYYDLVEDDHQLYKAPQEEDAAELDRLSIGWQIASDLLGVTLKAFGPMRQHKLVSWRIEAARKIDAFVKQLPK